jgi:hypothetical protein
MRICAIKHDPTKENFERFKAKLLGSLRTESDIIIGPSYALRYGFSSREKKERVYHQIREISQTSSSCIIPGTICFPFNDHEMVCEAPIFHKGNLLQIFHKEKENEEGDLAAKNGYTYRRGDNSKNRFNFNGKKIAVELCGDHGVQDVKGCDLELILAYDNRAGFWISAANDDFSRYAVVCDGYAPKVEAFRYDSTQPIQKMSIVKQQTLNNDMGVFDLDERNVPCL